MLHPVSRALLQPFIARISCTGGHVLRPVPNCFVRYRKKPWTPLSPTKLFRVPERVPQDPDEYAELFKLWARYRTAVKAIRYIGWCGIHGRRSRGLGVL